MFVVNPHTGEDEGEDPGVNPLQEQNAKPAKEDTKKAPEPFAGRGTVVEPVHQAGASGRPLNRRADSEGERAERAKRPNEGASGRGYRSPKVNNKNRKKKVA
jgi:hypothetical protein